MLQIHVNLCDTDQLLAGFPQSNGGKFVEAEDLKCVFVAYCVLESNRSALLLELLSNNSLFVGQMYENKSRALRPLDLIFFTTDLQTVNYYSNNSLLELIYFLKIKYLMGKYEIPVPDGSI